MKKDARNTNRVVLSRTAVVYYCTEQIPCRILNLSVKGMALVSPVQRPLGGPIRVEFYLGKGTGWVGVNAMLLRSERRYEGFVWGIAFEDLDFWIREYLASYIRERESVREAVA